MKARGQWFEQNPLSAVVTLPREKYRGRPCHLPKAWFVRRRGCVGGNSVGQPFFRGLDSNNVA